MKKKVLAVLLGGCMVAGLLAGCGGDSKEAVSYTHLDVYKRQSYISRKGEGTVATVTIPLDGGKSNEETGR